jgi:hypothetical protein
MPNDAKVGMILGLGLVILIAVVFFQKEGVNATSPPGKPSAAAVHSARPMSPPVTRGSSGVEAGNTERRGPAPGQVQSHTVREGETLFTLADRFFNDGRKILETYQKNRGAPQEPAPGVSGSSNP